MSERKFAVLVIGARTASVAMLVAALFWFLGRLS
jgi:hypothetical protein